MGDKGRGSGCEGGKGDGLAATNLGNASTCVIGWTEAAVQKLEVQEVVDAWRRVGDQLRDEMQRERLSEYFLCYLTVLEHGVLPPSPVDYSQPVVFSNNLCSLPIRLVAEAIELALIQPSSTPCRAAPLAPGLGCEREQAARASGGGGGRCLGFIAPNLGDEVLLAPAVSCKPCAPEHPTSRDKQDPPAEHALHTGEHAERSHRSHVLQGGGQRAAGVGGEGRGAEGIDIYIKTGPGMGGQGGGGVRARILKIFAAAAAQCAAAPATEGS